MKPQLLTSLCDNRLTTMTTDQTPADVTDLQAQSEFVKYLH